MRKTLPPFATVFSVILVIGCASGGSRSRGVGKSDVITSAELDEEVTGSTSLYEAIVRLRPNWLRSRGPTSLRSGPTLPAVILDGTRYGEVDSLRDLHVAETREVRFVNGRDATTKYGTGYTGGAIEVITY